MRLIDIKKQELNNFIAKQAHGPFLESWEWGEFQIATGREVRRLGIEEDGELIAAATLIKNKLPIGFNYWYCPRGPAIPNSKFQTPNSKLSDTDIVDFLFGGLEKIAKEEKVIFLRFEPANPILNSQFSILNSLPVQPVKTLLLDLRKSESELLAGMHPKTRYNIRLAEKKGVKIIEAGPERFVDFWRLMEKTGRRDGFRLHSKEHYEKMLSNFEETDYNSQFSILNSQFEERLIVKLFLAEYDGKTIAGSIVAFFGDTATYMHGASDNEQRNLMAPYLLQWRTIKSAKELGCKYYDFYGIDEAKWPGVTRFKRGFGGEEFLYPGTFDLVFDQWKYKAYKILRRIRRKI